MIDLVSLHDFVDFISSVDGGFRSCRQLWLCDSCGNFKKVFACSSSEFADRLAKFDFYDSCNYYITANSFINSISADRTDSNLFQLNNIVIDLDNHVDSLSVVHDEINFFMSLAAEHDFFNSSVIVHTKRGLQFWYHTSGDSIAFKSVYLALSRVICSFFEEFLNDNGIKLSVDNVASVRQSGLFRLPVSGCFVSYFDKKCFSFADLCDCFGFSGRLSKQRNYTDVSNLADSSLHCKRINILKQYVEERSGFVTGKRNTLLFLFYNAAVQVNIKRSDAQFLACSFASSFSDKYSDAEIKSVFQAVDKLGYYKISNQTFFDMLDIDYKSKSKKVKVDKSERDKRIKLLASQLMKQEAIAVEVGCSSKTVKRVLKNFNKKEYIAIQVQNLRRSMSISETAKSLNISVATVKRLQSGNF